MTHPNPLEEARKAIKGVAESYHLRGILINRMVNKIDNMTVDGLAEFLTDLTKLQKGDLSRPFWEKWFGDKTPEKIGVFS